MSTERCGFWQNGSCGREICLEVCRPAVYHLKQYGDVSQEEMDYYEKHGTLERTTQGRSVCPLSGVECGRDGKWCDECPKKPIGDEALLREALERICNDDVPGEMNAGEYAAETLHCYRLRATKGTPAQPEPITDDEQAQLYAYVHGTSLYPIVRRLYSAASRATQPAPVDERAAFEALSLLLIEVELSGNGESTDFGWPRALAAARAALAAAPKPGEKT